MYYSPEDHFSGIEAIISYSTVSNEFISSGIDCNKEPDYQLTESDKQFLSREISERILQDQASLTFIQPSPESEIMFTHLIIVPYHFFLVVKRENYSKIHLQMNDIVTYFRTSSQQEVDDQDPLKVVSLQHEVLFNFSVNSSNFEEMCDNCKIQGICAPKYLQSLFVEAQAS